MLWQNKIGWPICGVTPLLVVVPDYNGIKKVAPFLMASTTRFAWMTPYVLGVQSYCGNGNLLTALKCHFGEKVFEECAPKTSQRNFQQKGLHGVNTNFFYC